MSHKGDTLLTSDGKTFYAVFRWEEDNLILDNSNTFLNQSGARKRPKVLFGTKLVETMNWIEKDIGGFYYTKVGTSGPKQIAYLTMSRKIGHAWTSIKVGLNFGTTRMRDCNSALTAIGILCTWTRLTRGRLEGVCPRARLIEVHSTCIRMRDRVWSPVIKSRIC